MPATE
ncbi:hypothetical protein YPPY32_4131, partial [Yersinia pestis PY-32]